MLRRHSENERDFFDKSFQALQLCGFGHVSGVHCENSLFRQKLMKPVIVWLRQCL